LGFREAGTFSKKTWRNRGFSFDSTVKSHHLPLIIIVTEHDDLFWIDCKDAHFPVHFTSPNSTIPYGKLVSPSLLIFLEAILLALHLMQGREFGDFIAQTLDANGRPIADFAQRAEPLFQEIAGSAVFGRNLYGCFFDSNILHLE
jgi:hypothetical protein